jgi:hypothetical protein
VLRLPGLPSIPRRSKQLAFRGARTLACGRPRGSAWQTNCTADGPRPTMGLTSLESLLAELLRSTTRLQQPAGQTAPWKLRRFRRHPPWRRRPRPFLRPPAPGRSAHIPPRLQLRGPTRSSERRAAGTSSSPSERSLGLGAWTPGRGASTTHMRATTRFHAPSSGIGRGDQRLIVAKAAVTG